jgi:hypothetical protein
MQEHKQAVSGACDTPPVLLLLLVVLLVVMVLTCRCENTLWHNLHLAVNGSATTATATAPCRISKDALHAVVGIQ